MKEINLIRFNEIILTGDIKYLRFLDSVANKLYMVEDYSELTIDEKINEISRFNTIEEVKKYFLTKDDSTNFFEFVAIKDIKKYYDIIGSMGEIDRKKLATIIKEVKNLNIEYINFKYFFVQTKDEKLYFVSYNKRTNEVLLKNLKISLIFYPADYKKIVKDIKAYSAFKYQNRTIKYEDIKRYIENPLLSPAKDKLLIEGIRDEFRKENVNVQENKLTGLEFKENNKELLQNAVEDKEHKGEDKELASTKTSIKFLKNDLEKDNRKSINKSNKSKNKKSKNQKSLLFYCFIGFSIGILLAAITIVIGSFL